MKLLFVLVLFVLLLLVLCATGFLLTKPVDKEVLVGHSTYFNCSTSVRDKDVDWYYYPVGATGLQREYIYAFGRYDVKRFHIDRHPTGVCNLVIHSATLHDAGRYECQDDGAIGETKSAQLIVLAENPVCHSLTGTDNIVGPNSCSIKSDEIRLSCSVNYTGNIPPQMIWKSNEGNESLAEYVAVVNTSNSVSYELTMTADLRRDGSSYRCETTKSATSQYNCISDTISVQYVFSGDLALNKSMNDKIICSANTSQLCSYKWKWFQGDDSTTETNDRILRPKKLGWHRCEATCDIRNHTCTISVMESYISRTFDHEASSQSNIDNEKRNSSSGTTIIIVVLTVVTTSLVIVVIFVCVRIRKRKHQSTESGENSRLNENQLLHRDIECHKKDKDYLRLLEAKKVPAIYGLAVLKDELFISRLKCPEVEVYDSKSFTCKRKLNINGMTNPEHIVSCSVNNCLYVFDWQYQGDDYKILRIDPKNGEIINNWRTDVGGGRISVANDSNIILNVNWQSLLIEFTATGERVRVIALKSVDIIRSWHAIKLRNGLFVVCHGGYEDPLSRVCILRVKEQGDEDIYNAGILKVFGGQEGSSLSIPIYLAIDVMESTIMVSDKDNKRALLLNSSLENPVILISEVNGIVDPWRVCADNSEKGRWLIADYERVTV